ncbi:MAG TPA: isoprenylcysteine carboxylmethyltransferase family protein [Rhodocyclaceae bacterium]|nr:isoprenylcysteine carboxylmethyltransferase family protein [Rhodocyclaceae bacterium]
MNEPNVDLLLFAAGSAIIAWLSRKPLRHPGSHGFYRFFVWEGILVLVLMNRDAWDIDPYSVYQLIAWPLLMGSIALVVLGITGLTRLGRVTGERAGGALYEWEKTTALVTTGIFAYIRHPMYASLLALTWGTFLQAPSWPGAVIALSVSLFLMLTALADERECLAYFGTAYAEYMRRTRRFIPGVF